MKVRAGVDTIGSLDFLYSDLWRELAEAGGETMAALPVGNPLLTIYTRRPDLRNHRKITVIDGRICHCGNQNCADSRVFSQAALLQDCPLRRFHQANPVC